LRRRYPVGAELIKGEGVSFRVWAPEKKTIELAIFKPGQNVPEKEIHTLEKSGDYFEVMISSMGEGTLYKFRINGVDDYYPDPVSRYQPLGPHGPSEVINPDSFTWHDENWRGISPEDMIIYEMHFGTFTKEGTFRSAEEKLSYLADTGINMLEIMPVADFPGNFGWGYDGVYLFAPYHAYGTPDDLKSFVNSAHDLGISVILDVVYNHLGPDGNYLLKYSDSYISEKYKTDWGAAINYDDKYSEGVREFYKTNAAYWIEEYHMDGLRLDATQDIFDESEIHILAEIQDVVRESAGEKKTFIVTENEPQNCILVKDRNKGGFGFDAMWNDDFHHSAVVALTGKNEAYYTDYMGKAQEFISALKYGFLYQGQFYKWQKKRRGRISFDLHPRNLVNFIENHDQIANSGTGRRLHHKTSPAKYRAMTALFILAPQIPMIFQGQEFGSSAPFFYFADHKPELAKMVKEGRYEFLTQFRSISAPEMVSYLADPGDENTFLRSKLDHTEVEKNPEIYKLHKDLISLRKKDPNFRLRRIDGAVLGESCFVIRYFDSPRQTLLIVNLGLDLNLNPAPEPLLAPGDGEVWEIHWSSEHPSYVGSGTAPLETESNWIIPGHSAVVLKGRRKTEETNG
jgi:maltooligosyltrehalose trehalohydrolase